MATTEPQAENSERLMCYLTAPFLCIPLVLAFFAEKDLTGTLMNADLRRILESVLFEPRTFNAALVAPSCIPVPAASAAL